jgi:hypothetical protein
MVQYRAMRHPTNILSVDHAFWEGGSCDKNVRLVIEQIDRYSRCHQSSQAKRGCIEQFDHPKSKRSQQDR